MKNVNLTGLFLAMVAKFEVSGFELTSIIPTGKEPIDVLIKFKDANIGVFDLSEANEIVYEHITGEVRQATVSLKSGVVEVYIEFTNSEFLDTLD